MQKVNWGDIRLIALASFIFICFAEIPVLNLYPLSQVISVYPFLISLVLAFLVIVYKVYKTRKSKREFRTLLRLIATLIVLFWLFLQISAIIAIEGGYYNTKVEYYQYFKGNLTLGDELNSSWALVVKYRDEFEGTYGREEAIPNRVLLSNNFFTGFTH
jgi:hypothetical protein